MTAPGSASAAAVAPAVRLRHVSKVFGGVRALDDLDFEVGQGEVHCLAGENGCGKSTLIKIVTGVHAPEPGAEIELFGESVQNMTPIEARARGIAVIWQDLALFPEMSVAENIAFDTLVGARPRRVSHGRLRALAGEALESLGVSIEPDETVSTLPIAKRQIVAIARALVGDARLIFMDEPTASLTQTETDRLLRIVRRLSASGVAIVFVSHRLAEVIDIASRVTVVRDGRLVGVHDTVGMTPSRLTELMTGQNFDQSLGSRDLSAAGTVLDVAQLTREGEYADVSLFIRKGEVLGLTGLIGAGRTELAHTLFGMTPADEGRISLDGKPLALRSNRDAMREGIAYVSEDRLSLGLIQQQSIGDNIVLPVLPRLSAWSGLLSRRRIRETVAHWVRELSIRIGKPEDAVSTLSGGNQQRVVLSKWLTTEPKLLILDCPTVGVDVGARAGVFAIVQRLADQGLAILLISDEVSEVYFNADRVLHMAEGRIVGEHVPADMTLESLEAHIYA